MLLTIYGFHYPHMHSNLKVIQNQTSLVLFQYRNNLVAHKSVVRYGDIGKVGATVCPGPNYSNS